MTLRQWIKWQRDNGKLVTIGSVARKVGLSRSALHKIMDSGNPKLAVVRKINMLTKGRVRPSDWSAWQINYKINDQ